MFCCFTRAVVAKSDTDTAPAPVPVVDESNRSYTAGDNNLKPVQVGRTSVVFTDGHMAFKRIRKRTMYEREKRVIDAVCNGVCKYVLDGVSFDDDALTIIMPFYDTDVRGYISAFGTLDELTANHLCLDVSMGLFYIHTKGYVYGDLKTENVCLRNGDVRRPVIIDMGSCDMEYPTISMETASPEAMRSVTPLSYKHDVWTLGIFFMELTTSCEAIAGRVYDMREDWIRGPPGEIRYLRENAFFSSCTRMMPCDRTYNYFNFQRKL